MADTLIMLQLNSMRKTIEVELRGLLTEEQYNSLIEHLTKDGVAFESDDKDTYFFNVSSGIFKLCDEISKDQGKLSLKLGSEETGALKEQEIVFERKLVPDFLNFFANIGFAERHLVPQKRKNFFLKDSTLSLKYTPDFEYHFELEGTLLSDESQIDAEKERLQVICKHYGLVPLTSEELTERIKTIRKRIGFDK